MSDSLVIPTNSVYAGGTASVDQVLVDVQVGTASGLRPGRAVRLDSDGKLEVCPADSASLYGWLDTMNYTDPTWDGDSDPTADDLMRVVLALPGVMVRARTAADLSTKTDWGVHLKTAANGTLQKLPATATADDAHRITSRLLKGADGSGTEADILVVVA